MKKFNNNEFAIDIQVLNSDSIEPLFDNLTESHITFKFQKYTLRTDKDYTLIIDKTDLKQALDLLNNAPVYKVLKTYEYIG